MWNNLPLKVIPNECTTYSCLNKKLQQNTLFLKLKLYLQAISKDLHLQLEPMSFEQRVTGSREKSESIDSYFLRCPCVISMWR